MEENKITLKPKKEKKRFKDLFADRKKRYFLMLLCMLPFLIGIGVFGFMAYREVKNIMTLANGPTETKAENLVMSGEDVLYILRDNATDLQKQYFAQLKQAIEEGTLEDGSPASEEDIAKLVALNYVSDFYTWSNKQGQFDVGGMYFIYDGEYEDGEHFKENVYLAARDGFYKYINYYINKYGAENVLEVENIEVTKCQKLANDYFINEHVANLQDENGEWYDYREDHYYHGYNITCNWTYKAVEGLNTSPFANTLNLIVINHNDIYYVMEASESTLDGRVKEENPDVSGETETEEVEQGTDEYTEQDAE